MFDLSDLQEKKYSSKVVSKRNEDFEHQFLPKTIFLIGNT